MKIDSIRKIILPLGPIMSVTLIGILLLSALLYYRAVKIGRFLEPALAISQPRMEFTQNIRGLLSKEFGAGGLNGIRFTARSIFVDEQMLYVSAHHTAKSRTSIPQELSHVFLSALRDDTIRAHIDLILVIKLVPFSANKNLFKKNWFKAQDKADLILRSLYNITPELEKDFSNYFAATVIPADIPERENNFVEFRIIPSELVHIELLQRLRKYTR